MYTITIFALMILLMCVRVPIAVAIGMVCVIGLVAHGGFNLEILVAQMFTTNDSFPLLAIPFFILAGEIMSAGGISQRLVRFAGALANHYRGGLGAVAILSSSFFAAISGSNAATVAAIGGVMSPEMQKKGYSAAYTAATVAAAGVTGMIIPPSILLILYGVVTGVSITDLFIAGLLPGIVICISLLAVNWLLCKDMPVAQEPFEGFAAVWSHFKAAIWALLMPVIVLGGIYGGVFTPTESAVVAVLYGLIIGLAYRELSLRKLYAIFLRSTLTTAIIMLIMNAAGAFTWMITIDQIPQQVSAWLTAHSDSPVVFIVFCNLMLLVVGCFMNAAAAITVFTVILYPAALEFGIDPVLFGVIMTVNLSIGTVTPPVGVDLFVASAITNISLEKIVVKIWPYILMLVADLLLISFYAPLSLTLVEWIH